MYFSKFPSFVARVDGSQKIVTDFFVRVAVGKTYSELAAYLVPYIVKEGERPEDIAHRYYGNAEYHWVILLINNIIDPGSEWALAEEDLVALARLKYDNIFSIHHYVLDDSEVQVDAEHITDAEFLGRTSPVTNLEHEINENEKKRKIKLLNVTHLTQFVKSLEAELR